MENKLTLLIIFLLGIQFNLKSQNFKYGVFYNQNFSYQTHFLKKEPDLGKSGSEQLIRLGFGIFAEEKLSDEFSLQTRLGYQQRGGFNQIHFIENPSNPNPNPTGPRDDIFKFNYLSLELNPIYHFDLDFKINPYFFGGLSYNYLLKFEYNEDGEIDFFRAATVFENSKKHTLGAQLGFGFLIKKAVMLDLHGYYDVTPFLNEEEIWMKHFVWSVNLGMDLNRIF